MVNSTINGHNRIGTTSTSPRKASKGKGSKPLTRSRFRTGMITVLGGGIPLLSLALSHIGGTLLQGGFWPLAGLAFGLMASVLGVSLPHLAWSINDLTRSPRRACWLLAVALDLSLVLGELIGVYAGQLGLTALVVSVMCAVALVSMALNVHAFWKHR